MLHIDQHRLITQFALAPRRSADKAADELADRLGRRYDATMAVQAARLGKWPLPLLDEPW